jgi:hypothetical protein
VVVLQSTPLRRSARLITKVGTGQGRRYMRSYRRHGRSVLAIRPIDAPDCLLQGPISPKIDLYVQLETVYSGVSYYPASSGNMA